MNAIKKNLLYAGLEKDEFHQMMPQARAENQIKLRTCALVSLALFLGLALASLVPGSYTRGGLWCYVAMVAFSAVIYALARRLSSANPAVTTGLCCLFVAALYVFSLISSAQQPDMPAVTAIAVMLMGPFLFTERPILLIGMNVAFIALLCAMSPRLKAPRLASIDVWNAIVFGIIAIVAEFTQENQRFRLLSQTKEIKRLSETDTMTGCKNRNCFEYRQPRFAETCKAHLVCVFIDVNGLHNLNDSQGHAAGDLMLTTVAHALLDTFGEENTYRVGGDEFIVILPDASCDETRQRIAKVAAHLASLGYDISTGVVAGEKATLKMDDLVREAEQAMYEEKEKYYQQEGHDRRRR